MDIVSIAAQSYTYLLGRYATRATQFTDAQQRKTELPACAANAYHQTGRGGAAKDAENDTTK
jgi:hypothetical protein